ncbi:hypothetical protein E0493_09570 [Roseomonas sp. M0104]|uniref:Uncharacterized protein n=1 Tax=Teichococcus coralli TaxID=2545983 RepID=A0A845B9Z2_9PROT|nr:hypothetical protein [Pseudoroseomonas coralli]MXP63595.1 hypothetical protein [Pseudoroseomonas coralli]
MSDDRRRRARAWMAALLGAAALLSAGGARAQLRSLSVPAEAGVVVAPRGQVQPRLVRPPSALAEAFLDEGPAPLQLPAGGQGLAAPLGLILPMAAGALLGAGVAGGGSGSGSGPVRTR